MKYLVLFLSISTFACTKTVLNLCKAESGLHSKVKEKSIAKFLDRTKVSNIKSDDLIHSSKSLSSRELIGFYNDSIEFNREVEQCLLKKTAQNCYKFVMKLVVHSLYEKKYIDELSVLLFYNDLIFEKNEKMNLPDLKSYSSKVKMLNRKNQKIEASCFSCSMKGYQIGKLKNLSLNQIVLLKYSYFELAMLNDTLKNYNKRITSLKSGIYFDYDGDGVVDEDIPLDAAEQSRVALKLLMLELNSLNEQGSLLAGKRPQSLDLLVASSYFNEFDDELLTEMFSNPYLKERKVPFYKKILNVTRRITESVLMIIPGVNIYAVIPIVVVNAVENYKKEQNENSDLHIITF